MLMEQIDKHADLMAHILAGIAGGMVTKSMRDFIVKAAARRPGEVWQTNGRWYRKEGTRTVRIPKPGSEAEKKPAKAPKQAKPSKADLYASAKDAVAKLRGGDPGSIDEAMASLSALTVPELRKLAKESGLAKVPGRLKREIVDGLRDGVKASGGSVAGEPGTPLDAKAIKLTSEPLKELASEVAEKHGATVKGGELHTTYEQALEMISTLQDAESHFTAISKPGQAAKARWLIDALRLKHDLRPYLGTGIGGEKHRGTRLDPSFASIDPAFSARAPGHGGLDYVVGIEPVEGAKTQDGKVFRGGKWGEEGPKEGDRNEDGLVFRNGRWHRDDKEISDQFIGRSQMSALKTGLKGEEADFFRDKINEINHTIATMPKTYEQDGKGDNAVAHLHYFTPGGDWYITERDKETEQHQAFGLANPFGDGGELGYISIPELTAAGAELDLYWKPKTLAEIRGKNSEEPAKPSNPHIALAATVAAKLRDGESLDAKELFSEADKAHGGTRAEGKYGPSDAYDSLEAGVNMSLRNGTDPRKPLKEAVEEAKRLEDVVLNLPTQTNRSGNKDSFQQFSTPPHYAYAAAWLANIRPGDLMLEPTAGTGSLAVHAANAGAKIQANELDPRRAEFLKEQFGAENVTVENADHIDAILHAKGVRPSVVVMNPPFSQTAGRMGDKKVLMTGANHIEAALKTLQPNGRLVAIVGRGMDSNSATFKNWFKKVGQTYNLRANVAVSGDVYKKYGTHFGTRVLVFDNTGTTTEANVIKGEVSSIPELMATLEGVRNDRRKGQSVGGGSGESPPIGTGHVTAPGVGSGSGVAGPITGELGVRSAISEPGTGGAAIGGAGDGPGSSERRVTEGGGGPGKPSRKPRKQSDRKKPRAGSEDSGGKSGGDAANPLRLRPSEAIRLIESPKEGDVNADGLVFRNHRWHRLEDLQLDNASLTDDLFETYQPTKAIVEKSVQHNTPVVESAAMAAVEAPNVSYTPHLSPDIVEKGILSDVQLEAVIYAGQAHEQFLPAHEGEQAKRKGFFVGDGTGLGKGREIAGVIADNMNQGRKKHVWVSLNDPLFKDAQRDITALGISEDALFEFDELKKKGGPSEGICFMTYGTLRQKPTEKSVNKARNLERLVEWLGKDFDGVIAFDESHSLGNAMDQKGERGTKSASETALAGVELQKLLPNARVLYVSATGATEVENLAYAERLGIWGYGTAFPSKAAFITEMKTGGVAAMEAVAMSLKAQGSYMARSLSFKGIGYERLSHELTADQIAVYNSAAEGWQKVMQNIDAAIEASGMSAKDKSNKMSQFWGGELRFFDAVITSFQTQSVINDMEKQLAEGNSCVVQLTKTGAAQLERAIKEKDDDQDIEDLELGPKQILIDYLKKGFPVQKYESYLDEDGNEKTKVVLGADGKPLEDPKLVEMRDNLLADISTNLRDIDSPLDQIIGHFGVNAVAECTGRQSRRVTIPNERGVMETVIQERDPDAAKESETNDFQAGRKRILIFSDAGGTGRSYHADLGSANQQKRIHYLLQPGWRADKAVQGFGRSHRTNQKQPPVYRLVDCPAIPAQKRFVSTIARRLDSLGALTKGQRQTGSTGIFKETDNLESIYATQAMTQVFTDLYFNSVPGLDAEDVRKRMGLREPDPKNPQPPQPAHVRQFLNRMLVLDLDTQQKLFNAFDDRLVMKIEAAKKDDKFDKGVENFPAQKISKKQEDVVYTHPRSGAKVKHYVVEATFAEEKRKWEDNNRGMKPLYYVKNRGTGQVWGVFTAPDKTDAKRGEVYRQVKLHGPGTYQYRPATNVEASTGSYQKIEHDEAEKLWNEQYNALPASTTSDQHFVTGDMLTVWDRLPKDQPKIYRLRMDDGNTVVGRYVNPGDVDDVMRRLGSSYNRGATKQPTAVETHASVLAGTPTTLSNGWRLKSSLVQGERRIEIIGPKAIHASDLEKDGVIKERIGYDWRFFVPVGDSGHKTMERITALHPVVLGGSVGSSSASSMAAVGTPEPSRGMYEMTPVAEPLTRETVLPPAPAPEPVKAPEPPPFPGPGRLVRVTGDTYSNRKLFRTLGGTWDGSSWVLPSEKASVLQGTRGLKFHDYGPAPVPKPPEPENPNATKYHVSGNTFAHKDRIRAAGGKWDGANKVWVIPASAKDRIAHLPGLKFTGKRLRSPIYVTKAIQKNLPPNFTGLAPPDAMGRRYYYENGKRTAKVVSRDNLNAMVAKLEGKHGDKAHDYVLSKWNEAHRANDNQRLAGLTAVVDAFTEKRKEKQRQHEERVKVFEDKAKSLVDSKQLTKEQIKAIEYYGGDEYYSINDYLRGTKKRLSRDAATHIPKLDEAIASGSLKENSTVYRCMTIKGNVTPSKIFRVGRTFTDHAFVSTSLSKDFVDNFLQTYQSGQHKKETHFVLTISLPKGTNGQHVTFADGKYNAAEILLGRGSKFRVKSVTAGQSGSGKPRQHKVELEYIGSNKKKPIKEKVKNKHLGEDKELNRYEWYDSDIEWDHSDQRAMKNLPPHWEKAAQEYANEVGGEGDSGEPSESLAMLDALADILGGLYGKDALKHIPGLNRTPISKTYCILDGEVYRWSDGMLYKRLDGVWKASRHKPGEEWETRGRFYRREQGRTVRISKPGGKAIAVASDGAAEGTQTAAPKASKESAREAAKAKIAEIAKGGKSPESHKELMANLGKLTVVDLKAIAKEHNLKAPPRLKAALMLKLADHIGLKKTDPVSYETIRKMRLEHAGTKEATGPRSEPAVDVAKFHAELDSLLAESPKERKTKPVEKEKLRARNASDMLTEPESLMPANAKKKPKAPSEDDIKLDLPVIKTPIRAKRPLDKPSASSTLVDTNGGGKMKETETIKDARGKDRYIIEPMAKGKVVVSRMVDGRKEMMGKYASRDEAMSKINGEIGTKSDRQESPELANKVEDVLKEFGEGNRIELLDVKNKLSQHDWESVKNEIRKLSRQGKLTLYPHDDPRQITPDRRNAEIQSSTGVPQHMLYYGGHHS